MKIELKHLAPYLPYGLKVVTQYGLDVPKGGHIFEICGICERPDMAWKKGEIGLFFTRLGQNREMSNEYFEFRPALKPLSEFGNSDDLRKVHEFIGLGKWCDAYDVYFDCWFNDLANVDKLILQAPYEISQYFFANHYDVFSLIPQNLAIDLNTLKP